MGHAISCVLNSLSSEVVKNVLKPFFGAAWNIITGNIIQSISYNNNDRLLKHMYAESFGREQASQYMPRPMMYNYPMNGYCQNGNGPNNSNGTHQMPGNNQNNNNGQVRCVQVTQNQSNSNTNTNSGNNNSHIPFGNIGFGPDDHGPDNNNNSSNNSSNNNNNNSSSANQILNDRTFCRCCNYGNRVGFIFQCGHMACIGCANLLRNCWCCNGQITMKQFLNYTL